MNKRKAIPDLKKNRVEFSLNEFFGKDVFEKSAELLEYVNLPLFKRNETGVSQRNLNWWTSEEALRMEAKEAKRFSFVEFVWVRIVEQLRSFSVPLPLISSYKQNLLDTIKTKGLPDQKEKLKSYLSGLDIPSEQKKKLLETVDTDLSKKGTDTGLTLLHLVIMNSVLKRKPVSLAFFADGNVLLIDKEIEHLQSERNKGLLENGNYVRVSVSDILAKFLKSDLGFKAVPELRLLTLAENKLYEAVKTGEYESITVNFKDKKIKSLELKKNASVQKKIIDVLNENRFSEIVVKKHNGIVTRIEQNIKLAF